jgi:hypothetical protein
MPISISWYNDERRVIILKFEGSWDWDELRRVQEEEAQLAASVSHNLTAFVDLSHTNFFPQGNFLAQGRSSVMQIPDNVTQIIAVIQSRMFEVFGGLVVDMMPKWRNRVQFVKTVEEGQKRVAEAVATNQANSSAG